MARVILGRDLPATGERTVHALTLGELLERLRSVEPSLEGVALRVFVNGREARTLEGPATPVGDEDVVVVSVR